MPNRKISDNTNLLAAGLADADLLHIVDVSQPSDIDKNSKIQFDEFVTRLNTELNPAQVSVSANDIDTGFLATKIVGTANISITELNDGASETLQIDFVGGTLGEDYVNINSVGALPVATGNDAIAIGNASSATLGSDLVIIGNGAVGGALNSIAIGSGANVGSVGGADIAIGGNASVTATGGDMIAIGDTATIVNDTGAGNGSIVVGSSTATGNSNLLIGNNSSVNSNQNVLFGNQYTCLTDDNVAIGYAIQIGSSVGTQTLVGSQINNLAAGGGGNVVVGFSSSALGDASVTVGSLAACPGDDAVQLGTGTNSTNNSLQFRGKQIATDDGVQVETGVGAPVSTPADGHLFIDTSENRLYLRSSGLWFPNNNRIVLTANTIIYVNPTTGNDANDGFAPGAPLLTIQEAVDRVTQLDPREFAVSIQLQDGTYSQGQIVLKKNLVGTPVVIQGNNADNTAVVVDNAVASNISTFDNFGTLTGWTFADFTITNSGTLVAGGNYCIRSITGYFGLNNMRFLGTGGNTQGIQIAQQAIMTASGQTMDIAGTFQAAGEFLNITQSATVSLDGSTLNFAGGTSGGRFLGLSNCSAYTQLGLSTSGTFTGTRYIASLNSSIRTSGGVDTDVPGTIAGFLGSGAVLGT